jgi:hypothetical protein
MENHAIINYNEKTITLYFRWQTFEFDLTQGDIGEFWYGFQTHDGEWYDVNFNEEEGESNPSVSVYGTIVEEDGEFSIDSDNRFDIDIKGFIGNANNYFNYK